MEKIYKFNYLLLILLIPALVSGPFLSDLIVSLSAIFCLMYIFYNKEIIKKFKIIIILLISFSLYLVFSSIISEYKIHSLNSSIFYFRFFIFSLCFYIIASRYSNFISNFTNCFLITFLFVIFDSFYQFIFNVDLFGFQADNVRISGPFNDELKMGSFIARLLPILIGLICFKESLKYKNTLIFLIIFFSFVSVIISAERTSLFFFFISVLLMFFSSYTKKSVSIFFISLIIFTTLVFSFDFSNTPLKRIEFSKERIINVTLKQIYSSKDGKKTIRLFSNIHESHYKTAFNMFIDSPIFGVGPNNFRKLCDDKRFKYQQGCATHPHNSFIQVLAETGIFGLSFLLLITFFIFKNIYLSITKHNTSISYFFYIAAFITCWPLIPTGNFFNNWINIIYYLPFPLILFFSNNNILKNK